MICDRSPTYRDLKTWSLDIRRQKRVTHLLHSGSLVNSRLSCSVFRDCMKGDETDNKKIGCTVNLLVRFNRFSSPGRTSPQLQTELFVFGIFSEFLQVGDQQGGDVHPLHPQTVWYAPPGWELHWYCAHAHSITYNHTHTLTHSPVHAEWQVCVWSHRGGVHSAALLGAAALGRAASQRLPALSRSDRVASQGGALPQSHPLLQQGQGESTKPSVSTCPSSGALRGDDAESGSWRTQRESLNDDSQRYCSTYS